MSSQQAANDIALTRSGSEDESNDGRAGRPFRCLLTIIHHELFLTRT